MKLIDKDALMAKIRKRLLPVIRDKHYGEWEEGQDSERIAILDIINTLEVKEVDLEKEFESFLDNIEGVPRMWHSDEQIEWAKDIAKHFFGLGISIAQPHINIPNIDDILKEGGIEPNSKVAKMFKESYYKALDNTLHKE